GALSGGVMAVEQMDAHHDESTLRLAFLQSCPGGPATMTQGPPAAAELVEPIRGVEHVPRVPAAGGHHEAARATAEVGAGDRPHPLAARLLEGHHVDLGGVHLR